MRRHIPNALSLSRLVILLPLAFVTWLNGAIVVTVILFITAIASDILDGYLARRWHAETCLGAWLDKIADTEALVIIGTIIVTNGWLSVLQFSILIVILHVALRIGIKKELVIVAINIIAVVLMLMSM